MVLSGTLRRFVYEVTLSIQAHYITEKEAGKEILFFPYAAFASPRNSTVHASSLPPGGTNILDFHLSV